MLNIDTSNYPIDAQRVYNLFKENENLLGVNLLYRASHDRVYNRSTNENKLKRGNYVEHCF